MNTTGTRLGDSILAILMICIGTGLFLQLRKPSFFAILFCIFGMMQGFRALFQNKFYKDLHSLEFSEEQRETLTMTSSLFGVLSIAPIIAGVISWTSLGLALVPVGLLGIFYAIAGFIRLSVDTRHKLKK